MSLTKIVNGVEVAMTSEEEAAFLAERDALNSSKTDRQQLRVRTRRDELLTRCDWTQLPDSPVDKQAWADYRQALRDVPSQSGFPYSVVWPEEPTGGQ
jgi:hypothetical protein